MLQRQALRAASSGAASLRAVPVRHTHVHAQAITGLGYPQQQQQQQQQQQCGPPTSPGKRHDALCNAGLAKQDFYELLGVSRDASERDIKKAYFQLAKKYHPDTNPGDEAAAQKFAEISEAYEVLSDSQKRQQYDQFGSTGPSGGFGGQQGFGGGFSSNPEDIFREFMRNMGMGGAGEYGDPFGGAAGFRQQTFVTTVRLSFMESVKGASRTLTFPSVEACSSCKGSGSATGKTITCPVCNGSGVEHMSMGFLNMQSACRKCAGTGQVPEKSCKDCKGSGSVKTEETVSVNIPAGVEDGMQLQVGNHRVISIEVEPSRQFRRKGTNVFSTARISLPQAVLGGRVHVPGLYGDMAVKVPAGTNSGQRLKLRDRGFQSVHDYTKGAHILELVVDVPVRLSDEERELYEQLALREANRNGEVTGIEGVSRKVFVDEEELAALRRAAERAMHATGGAGDDGDGGCFSAGSGSSSSASKSSKAKKNEHRGFFERISHAIFDDDQEEDSKDSTKDSKKDSKKDSGDTKAGSNDSDSSKNSKGSDRESA
ncbi:dnaJ protein [Salpingoeca rosetta]|uniref:DnaJ protein n=1 Tax=Salpingoeca rosetta (strain ATCC 50818 / BSB-021) TaxID=946362 RepID=F2U883_SALR5|nr:dnaJ protein [Salpingoeca rosetta]EGD72591.1 dnaJ protein [Salpingoeca rosetta]|eukprot:XP_004994414.1 dnaJ protein [Salpingoeca rosetta]